MDEWENNRNKEKKECKESEKKEETRSRGRMLGLISRLGPKAESDPLTAPDRGAQSVCDWWVPVASAI